MRAIRSISLLLLAAAALPEALSISTNSTTVGSPTPPNANHIFNAITSALRQWGSSWNHNGMSLFRATVPAGVLLYHGRPDNQTVMKMEWLAFEPEHALMFARGMSPPPPRGGWDPEYRGFGKDDNGKGDGMETDAGGLAGRWRGGNHDRQHAIGETDDDGSGLPSLSGHLELRRRSDKEYMHVGEDEDAENAEDLVGYLHHYRSLRDINLLYIDGMSAGKTLKGTLDTQDYLLLSQAINTTGPFFNEFERALRLCNLTRTIWAGRVDGFIRMECGFEILLCQFEGNVGLDRMQGVRHRWVRRNQTMEEWEKAFAESNFRMYEAVSDRFWGLGGNRVKVDFDDFVTAFSKEKSALFERIGPTGELFPRLKNVSESDLKSLKNEVTQMVQNPAVNGGINWQSVSDTYVQRYAMPLQALLLPDLGVEDFHVRVQALLRAFASDYLDNEEVGEVIERCAGQFLPNRWNESLAGRAIQSVGLRICGVLVNSLFNTTTTNTDCERRDAEMAAGTYDLVRQEIRALVTWLDWPIWRYCWPGCAANEVCVLPIWPIADSIKDRERPNCKNSTTLLADRRAPGDNGSYWYGPDDFLGEVVI